ncbi:cobalamin biosynthesis protein [Gymnodinialimonas sp. 57CJ19]|uniref:cobalamin biosynthesis protein n=1 Tax=Gymnodinialimonas sp. 57CJ19 TaxID=3138498 RepID=UPI00313436FC
MIVAGFGFRTSATVDSLADAYGRAGGGAGRLATTADKARSDAMIAFSAQSGVSLVGVFPDDLTKQATITLSTTSQKQRSVGSVAEAAALAAAGPGARLLAPRVISADRLATCALASTFPEGETS